tara:strand:+ start:638 stop:1969 length:1332 start_codon:yes stop_codon:yes gene_type:complete
MSIKLIFKKLKKRSNSLICENFEDSNNGFTIIELAAVVAILSILSSITIVNVSKWVKLANISQAKTIVDNSIVECLQSIRSTGDLPQDISISNDLNDAKLTNLGYKIKNPDSANCSDLSIVPINESEQTLFEFGFQISNNNVNKIAYPANDQSSLGSCKDWAGINCGVSEEQLAIWAAEQALAEERSLCLNNYSSWLSGGSGNPPAPPATGCSITWNDSENNCSLPVCAFQGALVADAQAVADAQDAQRSGICNGVINQYRNQNHNGAVQISECETDAMVQVPTYYFCNGVEQGTLQPDGSNPNGLTLMNTCFSDNIILACEGARNTALSSNHTGPYTPSTSGDVNNVDGVWPVECTTTTYMCNGSEYSSLTDQGFVENCGSYNQGGSIYPCHEPPGSDVFYTCCPAGLGGMWCRNGMCGPEGYDPTSSDCSNFNSCSCFEPP